ncbi:unnamed protein product [Chironomus riparius]|uniref:Uncharacterized protein n=1 Tax=Chironomus riparius TaxID=315576 RepID=A0A9N9WTG4_9DIPT|nr:unnamed protein product [Chironomus riparius]
MEIEVQREVNSQIKHVMELVEKDREIQAFKDELVKRSIRSWNLQLIQKDKELFRQQEYILELESEIEKQNSRSKKLEKEILKLRQTIIQQNEINLKKTEKIKRMKKYGKSKNQKDME